MEGFIVSFLGIDYGKKRIGLSLAEDDLAYPLTVLENKKSVLDKIKIVCVKHAVSNIVIGLPEGKLVDEIKKFAQDLTQLTSLPADFELETLTTQEAVAKMIQAGKGKKVRQQKKDAFAAAIILQNYLEARANKSLLDNPEKNV